MTSPVPPAPTPDPGLPQADGSEAPLSLTLLQEKAERYQVMFSTASEGILVHSLDGKALEVNEAFARMHGYTQAEMLAMNLRELNVPGGFRTHPERIARILAGEALTFEVEHVHKDGHTIAMEVLVSLVSGGTCRCCWPSIVIFRSVVRTRPRRRSCRPNSSTPRRWKAWAAWRAAWRMT